MMQLNRSGAATQPAGDLEPVRSATVYSYAAFSIAVQLSKEIDEFWGRSEAFDDLPKGSMVHGVESSKSMNVGYSWRPLQNS